MLRFVVYVALALSTAGMNACRQPQPEKPDQNDKLSQSEQEDAFIEANKTLARIEETEIEGYIDRYGWDMEKTSTGLRYMVYHEGYGVAPVNGDKVMLNYTLTLINGYQCYSSKEHGQKVFTVGQADVEQGLHEAVLLMKVGDKAKLILPSALGFGLMGDQDCIPKRATLIYDVELTGIIKQ